MEQHARPRHKLHWPRRRQLWIGFALLCFTWLAMAHYQTLVRYRDELYHEQHILPHYYDLLTVTHELFFADPDRPPTRLDVERAFGPLRPTADPEVWVGHYVRPDIHVTVRIVADDVSYMWHKHDRQRPDIFPWLHNMREDLYGVGIIGWPLLMLLLLVVCAVRPLRRVVARPVAELGLAVAVMTIVAILSQPPSYWFASLHTLGLFLFGIAVVISAAFVAGLTYWRQRPDDTLCTVCGYNLRGNTIGSCPECGKAISLKQQAQLRAL